MNPAEQIIVLNVDDLESQRYVKTRDLTAGGFAVIEARTGAEALRLVEHHRPPVVLLDVQLPDIDGFEVCAFIKRKWPEVMVLQTSATFTTVMDRVSGLNAGADSYLVQPAEPLELAAARSLPRRTGNCARRWRAERRSNRNYCRPRRWKPSAN
jgi:DNA-binding response OmpR family regulator